MRGRSLRGLRFAMLAAGSGVFAWLLWSLGFNVIRQNVLASRTLDLLLGPDRHRVGSPGILGTIVAGFAMNYASPIVHMGEEPFRMMGFSECIDLSRTAFATIAFKAFNTSSMQLHSVRWQDSSLFCF